MTPIHSQQTPNPMVICKVCNKKPKSSTLTTACVKCKDEVHAKCTNSESVCKTCVASSSKKRTIDSDIEEVESPQKKRKLNQNFPQIAPLRQSDNYTPPLSSIENATMTCSICNTVQTKCLLSFCQKPICLCNNDGFCNPLCKAKHEKFDSKCRKCSVVAKTTLLKKCKSSECTALCHLNCLIEEYCSLDCSVLDQRAKSPQSSTTCPLCDEEWSEFNAVNCANGTCLSLIHDRCRDINGGFCSNDCKRPDPSTFIAQVLMDAESLNETTTDPPRTPSPLVLSNKPLVEVDNTKEYDVEMVTFVPSNHIAINAATPQQISHGTEEINVLDTPKGATKLYGTKGAWAVVAKPMNGNKSKAPAGSWIQMVKSIAKAREVIYASIDTYYTGAAKVTFETEKDLKNFKNKTFGMIRTENLAIFEPTYAAISDLVTIIPIVPLFKAFDKLITAFNNSLAPQFFARSLTVSKRKSYGTYVTISCDSKEALMNACKNLGTISFASQTPAKIQWKPLDTFAWTPHVIKAPYEKHQDILAAIEKCRHSTAWCHTTTTTIIIKAINNDDHTALMLNEKCKKIVAHICPTATWSLEMNL